MAKSALISLVEPRQTGYRVAQVVDSTQTFATHENYIWVDCDNTIIKDKFYYVPEDGTFNEIPTTTDEPFTLP
jgi:hypothetical protein